MDNNKSMKKYFLKETGEELVFGDVIELNCVKELEDGRAVVEREIKFSPETVDALLHFGLIEAEESLIDFSDNEEENIDLEEFIETVNEDLDDHERRILELEKSIKELEQIIKDKIASSKKK